ncbi:hypothetical protein [Acinetobacter sp. WZC-1]|uniref:hypothetical protein n=1 Tax=Acinetobacter sp. WZC-1 TaxID=3459034 RepID=UPI00403D879B
MKKLFPASLCNMTSVGLLAFALTACGQQPDHTASASSISSSQTAQLSLSRDNAADIKSDLTQLETLSSIKAREESVFRDEVTQAVQKKDDPHALNTIVAKMKSYVEGFNQDLDALTLKSTEANALRDKMKQSNHLGLELSEAGIARPLDINKINALQQQATELELDLMADKQTLQIKAGTAR